MRFVFHSVAYEEKSETEPHVIAGEENSFPANLTAAGFQTKDVSPTEDVETATRDLLPTTDIPLASNNCDPDLKNLRLNPKTANAKLFDSHMTHSAQTASNKHDNQPCQMPANIKYEDDTESVSSSSSTSSSSSGNKLTFLSLLKYSVRQRRGILMPDAFSDLAITGKAMGAGVNQGNSVNSVGGKSKKSTSAIELSTGSDALQESKDMPERPLSAPSTRSPSKYQKAPSTDQAEVSKSTGIWTHHPSWTKTDDSNGNTSNNCNVTPTSSHSNTRTTSYATYINTSTKFNTVGTKPTQVHAVDSSNPQRSKASPRERLTAVLPVLDMQKTQFPLRLITSTANNERQQRGDSRGNESHHSKGLFSHRHPKY